MVYTAKNILDRALSLADMSNTSFLTYKEKLDYLNQAWKQALQSAINKGCKYFTESVMVDSGEWDLPDDFYQIESLRTLNGTIIPRHNASTSDSSLSYDVVGNKLRVYGNASNLQLNYWKTPIFLSYPSNITSLDLGDIQPRDIQSTYGSKILYRKNDELYVYDVETTDTTFITEIPEGADVDVIAGKYYCYVAAIVEDTKVRMLINYKGQTLSTLESDNISLDENGIIEEYESNDYSGFIVKSGDYIYGITDRGVLEYTTNTYIANHQPSIMKPITFDSMNGVILDNKIYVEGDVIDTDVKGFRVIDLLKADWNTGNGYLVYNGNNYEVQSFVPDTALNFPSTMLFEYLSYLLAYLFTLKSGADTSAISNALSVAEYAFYDSLDNGGSYPRIINVY